MKNHFKTSVLRRQTSLLQAICLAGIIALLACNAEPGVKTVDGKKVLSIYVHGAARTSETSEVQKILWEKIGYQPEITYLVGDQAVKSGVMLASGEYPDIINMREDTTKFVDAGVYIPLEDLITEYAPRVYELYKPYWERIKNADGHIYTIPEGYPMNPLKGGVAGSGTGIGLYMQKAVLEWAGYPSIENMEQYFDILKRYKEAFPQIGDSSTIGFAFPAEGWRYGYMQYSHSFLTGYPNESGPLIDCVVDGKVDKNSETCSGTWVPRDPFYQADEFYSVFKIYNQAYLAGLIPKETVVQTHEQYVASISTGRVLGVFDQGWEFGNATVILKNEHPDRLMIGLPTAYSPDIKLYNGVPTPNYGAGFGISVSASDPVEAIKFIDAMLAEDVIRLTHWGVEGEDYLVDDQGVLYRTPEMRAAWADQTRRNKRFGDVAMWYISGIFDDGNAAQPNSQPGEYFANLSEPEKEVAEAYGVKSLAELFPPPTAKRLSFSPLWTFSFDQDKDADYIEVTQKRGDYINEYVTKLIFAEEGQYDKVWDEFNAKMASIPNSDVWLTRWNEKLQERVANWKE